MVEFEKVMADMKDEIDRIEDLLYGGGLSREERDSLITKSNDLSHDYLYLRKLNERCIQMEGH